ncbi:hypothetical protein JUJ52_05620 [Virgibacillus sp. AGTR]|uniref:hypothetical protein n=1 Tax=Virgibacillus TaxID=84406 RepID=UPI0012697B69|nr:MULTISPECIES: hypothetical protein [Bacillaceae]MCC2249443.1 hypothetical protein [Virgibacillus sp. AGTR]MDY7043359.1 hypothetical protein [Virgibacillus sp. M23]QRZ17811.1 hypothetical protein JUJ52_19080 [Virgibacillus sp. AGTR]
MNIVSLLGVTFLAVFLISTEKEPILAAAKVEKQSVTGVDKGIANNTSNEQVTNNLSHDTIIKRTNQLLDFLQQDTDENYQVITFNTKQELLEEFSKIATKNVVEPYIDYYYQERSNGLYIIPTEIPPWIDENNSYRTIPVHDDKVKLIQHNKSALHGKYTIEIEFTYEDIWRISNIKHS